MGKVVKGLVGAVVTVGLLAATAGGIGGLAFFQLKGWAAAAALTGVMTAATFVLGALSPKPKGFSGVPPRSSTDYRQTVRESVVPVRWVFGRARVGGVLLYANDYLASEGGDTDSNTVQSRISTKGTTPSIGSERRTSASNKVSVGSGSNARECYEYRNVRNAKTGVTTRTGSWGPCSDDPEPDPETDYVPDRTNKASLAGTEGLFMVFALTQGQMDRIEKIWVDGALMPFSESGGVINPTADEVDDVKFKHEGKTAIRLFVHRGEDSGGALNSRWGRSGVLRGISAVGVELTQYDDKPWQRTPSLEFQIKGVRMTWPGQTAPVWTENAAAIRYYYMTQCKDIPAGYIDETRFRAAYAVCNQTVNGEIRYSINGVVSDDEDYDQVVKQMDFAWAGTAPEINGKVVYNPGAPGSIKKTFTQDDLVAGEDPAWQIETPIYQQADAVDAVIAADVDSDFLPYSMARVGSTALDAAVSDLGTLAYVGHVATAQRLMAWNLKHIQQQRRARVHVRGQDGLTNWSVTCTDRVVVNIPTQGMTNERFYVEGVQYEADGSLHLDLVEEPSDLYDYTHTALLPYIQDTPFVPVIMEASGVSTTRTENPDGATWDVYVTCNESLDGRDLQLRYRFADDQPWILGGTGATLRGLGHGALQVATRIIGRGLATDWTPDSRALRVTLPNRSDPAAGPQLSFQGETSVLVGTGVNITVQVILEDVTEDFTYSLSSKPSWLTVTKTDSDQAATEFLTLTGTMVAGIDITMELVVTDDSGRVGRIDVPLVSTYPPLVLSGIGDRDVPQNVPTTVGTVTSDSDETITWSVAPAVTGVAVSTAGVVTAQLATLGNQDVTIKAVEAGGLRRTNTITITLRVIAAVRFAVSESNPVLLFDTGTGLYMGGLDQDRIYRLDRTLFMANNAGATEMPAGWSRASSTGTYTLVWASGGMRRVTRITAGLAIQHSGYALAASEVLNNLKYFALSGTKLYAVHVETSRTVTQETYQGNCRTQTYQVCTSYTTIKGTRRCDNYETRTRTICDTLTRNVTTTTTRLVLRVGTLGSSALGATTRHVIESTTSERSYSLHGVAVVGSYVYIAMTRAGTKGIWRCSLTGASLSKRTDRSEADIVDIAGDGTNVLILDAGADRVNKWGAA